MYAADTQRSTSLPALGYDKILQKRLTLSQKKRENGTARCLPSKNGKGEMFTRIFPRFILS
jgi:hypothetical protein